MSKKKFTGDKKIVMTTLLAPLERKLIDSTVDKFPSWIEGWHFTLMTIIWSAGLIAFGYLAAATENLHWLWLSSLMLFLQWFTDCFDGALGRHRDFGIPKWGFYMDHLLDFVFMCAIIIGYSFLAKTTTSKQIIYFLIPVFGTFMSSSFLSFGATGEFKITYLGTGPTEMRIAFIVLNTIMIVFGIAWIEPILPYVFAISILLLCFVVFRTQKYIWAIDMADKRARTEQADEKSSD